MNEGLEGVSTGGGSATAQQRTPSLKVRVGPPSRAQGADGAGEKRATSETPPGAPNPEAAKDVATEARAQEKAAKAKIAGGATEVPSRNPPIVVAKPVEALEAVGEMPESPATDVPATGGVTPTQQSAESPIPVTAMATEPGGEGGLPSQTGEMPGEAASGQESNAGDGQTTSNSALESAAEPAPVEEPTSTTGSAGGEGGKPPTAVAAGAEPPSDGKGDATSQEGTFPAAPVDESAQEAQHLGALTSGASESPTPSNSSGIEAMGAPPTKRGGDSPENPQPPTARDNKSVGPAPAAQTAEAAKSLADKIDVKKDEALANDAEYQRVNKKLQDILSKRGIFESDLLTSQEDLRHAAENRLQGDEKGVYQHWRAMRAAAENKAIADKRDLISESEKPEYIKRMKENYLLGSNEYQTATQQMEAMARGVKGQPLTTEQLNAMIDAKDSRAEQLLGGKKNLEKYQDLRERREWQSLLAEYRAAEQIKPWTDEERKTRVENFLNKYNRNYIQQTALLATMMERFKKKPDDDIEEIMEGIDRDLNDPNPHVREAMKERLGKDLKMYQHLREMTKAARGSINSKVMLEKPMEGLSQQEKDAHFKKVEDKLTELPGPVRKWWVKANMWGERNFGKEEMLKARGNAWNQFRMALNKDLPPKERWQAFRRAIKEGRRYLGIWVRRKLLFELFLAPLAAMIGLPIIIGKGLEMSKIFTQ